MRIALIVFTLAIVPTLIFSESLPASVEDEMATDLAAIESFYPRLEGSLGEKRTIAHILARLSGYGIPFTTFDFSQSDFEHSFSSCIRVDIAGTSRDTLIIAVPLDHAPDAPAVEDGAANITIALGLLHQLQKSIPPVSISVLFLGAEFGSTDEYPLGSSLFLRDFQPDYRVAVLYLNLRGIPSRVEVRGGGTGIVSPYWLMDRCIQSMREARIDFTLRGYENQVFRLGLAGERTIIEPYLRAGYPAVSLEGKYEWEHPADVRNWLVSSLGFFTNFLHASAGGIPEDWDLHYLLFQEGGISLIVTEKVYVAILLAVLAGMLFYSLLFRRGLKKYIRTMARNFWSILPVYAIPFLLLLVATYALEGILALRGFSTLWSYAPLPFLFLKFVIPLLIFSALYGIVRKLRFPRNGSFYSAASLFFLLIDILVVAAINISFSFYFLWAFIFVLLASATANRWVKLLLFLPSAFWGVRGLVEVFFMPALPFCRFMLLSPIRGNLLIAAIILPFVLFTIRLALLFRGPAFLRRGARPLMFTCLFSAVTIMLASALLIFSPFGPDRQKPVTVTQTIDEDTAMAQIEISSPAPIGEVSIHDESGNREISSRRSRIVIDLPPEKVPVKVTQRESEFLNKKNVFLEVQCGGTPRSLSARLTSTDEFILLDCTFPFIRESAHEYRLLVGAFPPDPLPLQLTLPSEMKFTLTLTMDFDAPLIGVEVDPRDGKVRTQLHYVKRVDLQT